MLFILYCKICMDLVQCVIEHGMFKNDITNLIIINTNTMYSLLYFFGEIIPISFFLFSRGDSSALLCS